MKDNPPIVMGFHAQQITLGSSSGRSRTIPNSLNPVWEEDVFLGTHRSKTALTLTVYDADSGLEFGDDLLGSRSMRMPFCSMFSAPRLITRCNEKPWEHCSVDDSSWKYPIGQSCNETGWVALDGSDDNNCLAGGNTPCLQIRVKVVPFIIKVEDSYSPNGMVSTTVAAYDASVGFPWAQTYGRIYADSTAYIDRGLAFSRPLVGGILLKTLNADKNFVGNRIYASFSMNFPATVWLCRDILDAAYTPTWLEDWTSTGYRIKTLQLTNTWTCRKKAFPATSRNQFNYLTSPPVYLYGNRDSFVNRAMTTMYVVIIVPIYDDDLVFVPATWDNKFTRGPFWRTVGQFGVVFAVFAYMVICYLRSIKLRLDRIETQLMKHATAGMENNILAALFLCYNETKNNMDFRRNLYFATLATKFIVSLPLWILWLWGVVAMYNVNPPAVGYGILFIGTAIIMGYYGFSLWHSMGWCMTGMAFNCLGLSAVLTMVFIIVTVFANPAVYKGGEPLDFLSLSAVFGTLNLIPLIFRAFSSDKSLARAVNQLLATVGMAGKTVTGKKEEKGILINVVNKTLEKPSATGGPKKEAAASAPAKVNLLSPFNTLLGTSYTIHVSIPYFKRADMVAVILKRCTGQVSKMSSSLYGLSVALLLLYAIIASVQTRYLTLGWANMFAILFLDLLHYLLGRGSNSWAPGHDVAIMSGGRMFISVICGKYWLVGYSFAYMLYGYALTDAIINKYLPHMTKAEAGAVAFFGLDSYLRTNFDLASSPEFCFGFLSFGFIALLLACAYVRPAGFPLPSVPIGGFFWPVYVFGVMAFLFILISCLTRATFRAFYLHRENLLMGAFRDSFFWSDTVRVPVVLAILTQVLVICSGLLIYAATKASIVFTLSIFLPPIIISVGFLYTKWSSNDYVLIVWPPP
jgi:hypothetical protein